MNEQDATRLIHAPPARIRAILLDPLALPEWNPAFHTITGPPQATTGTQWPITARGNLRGYWEYAQISDLRVDTVWQVTGLHETGTWELAPDAAGTRVTHAFGHRGPLAVVLSRAYAGVAELRLDRLAERVASR